MHLGNGQRASKLNIRGPWMPATWWLLRLGSRTVLDLRSVW